MQQKIVAILLDIFPNIQFAMTTQSSDVLADLPDEYTFLRNILVDLKEGDNLNNKLNAEFYRRIAEIR